MSSVLARASLRYLGKHPAQLVLAVLGVAVGVAVVVGIDTASASARASFESATSALSGGATHVVRGGPNGIDERVFARLALDSQAPPMAPVIERTLPSPPRIVQLLGVDPFSEARFRPLVGTRGSIEIAALLRERRCGALAAPTARALGIAVGDELPLLVRSTTVDVRVAALFEPPSALGDLLVVDIATAQELLGNYGFVDRIDLALPSDAAARERALEHVRSLLPADCVLEEASQRASTLTAATRAFELNLRALGFVALIVGVFLVYNTMTFSVVQRRPLWGTLRAIGATRREIFGLVCREALAIGAVGTALGLLLGMWLARGMSQLVSRTINDLYYRVQVRELALEPRVLLEALALGIGATLVGALLPARAATRTPPRATLDRAEPETTLRARAGMLALIGAGVCASAWALLALPTESLLVGLASLLVLLVGAALIVPLATVAVCRALVPLAALVAGNIGRAAVRGVSSHLARSSVAIAALAVALAASSAMGIVVHSFRGSVERWLTSALVADVYVSALSNTSNRDTQTLEPSFVERVTSTRGVAEYNVLRDVDLRTTSGEMLMITAMDLSPRSEGAYRLLERGERDPWLAFRAGEGVLVAEPLARRLHLRAGDELEFAAPDGPRKFAVVAVFRDYSTDRGWVLMPRRAYQATWNDAGVTALGLFAAPGVQAQELVDSVFARRRAGEVAHIRTRRELIDVSLIVFDRTFAVTRVLRLLSGVVAFLGVAGALLAMTLEREREFGVLRAIGLGPRGLRALVLGQTGVLGAIAGLFAMPIGVVVALVLMLVVNARSFGWTLDVDVQASTLVETFALALVASLLAGVVPALRMASKSPAQVLRGD